MDTTNAAVTQEFVTNKNVHRNLSVPVLVEKILSRDEAVLSKQGAVRATTGKYTGRSPKDRFIVRDEVSDEIVDWGSVKQPIDEESFNRLYTKVINHLNKQDNIFSFKGFAGADNKHRLPVEIINEYAWHNLFAQQLFITPTEEALKEHETGFTVLSAPTCYADPEKDGTTSETFIVISFKERVVLIGGTEYAGEIKKS